MALDSTDLRILDTLQRDATVSTSELAQRVGLSQSPCWRRISQLETDGVIRRRVALLSRERLGLAVMVIVQVKLASHGWQSLPKFKQKVVSFPEVVQCFMVLGDTDFVLLVATRSIEEYNEFIQKRLSQIEGVHAIESRMVLEETKHTTELPLQLLGLRPVQKSVE
jgi:Lrp/AsnC family transcriptional regulator